MNRYCAPATVSPASVKAWTGPGAPSSHCAGEVGRSGPEAAVAIHSSVCSYAQSPAIGTGRLVIR